MAPVAGPGNPSGKKTGMNRRTADARFSTTGGNSPDSPQSRSAGLRDRTLSRIKPGPRGELSTQAGPGAYALLTDGTTIEIRAARPEDFAAVRELHARMSLAADARIRLQPARPADAYLRQLR